MARIAFTLSLMASLLTALPTLVSADPNCIVAGADNTELTGLVSEEIYQGQKYWMLTMDEPVCAVSPGSESPAESGLPESFIRLQIADSMNEADLRQYAGQRVQLLGHVFAGQQGKHITALLIDVTSIQPRL